MAIVPQIKSSYASSYLLLSLLLSSVGLHWGGGGDQLQSDSKLATL
jgi:hypothetical protein